MVTVTEIRPGDMVAGDGWRVLTAHAPHVQPYLDSIAYRFEADGRTVVITGDTRVCEGITKLSKGADVLMMMCWEADDHMEYAGKDRASSSIKDCAETARAADVKQLVMVHLGPRLHSPEMIESRNVEVASTGYGGRVIWGEELTEVEI
jgi:ribonuclease Z